MRSTRTASWSFVSTKVRYGGFAKSVGLGVLTTPHGLGYAKFVIVVDADVDPFNLDQVMWAMSVRANPAGDIVIIPNLAENLLDPAGQPAGMAHKMIIDATTPVAPDRRGDYGELLDTPKRPSMAGQAHDAAQGSKEVRQSMAKSSLCPRCRSNATAVRAQSPVAGVWTIFGCDTCFYTWRSTELVETTDPDKYPEVFRLNPVDPDEATRRADTAVANGGPRRRC